MASMNWSHLETFIAIARAGSLTGAAHLLGTDQTTVGRRLNTLEADLRQKLFKRSKAGFLLTEAGERVLTDAQAVNTRLSRMIDDLADPDRGAEGIVRLFGNTWTLARLASRGLDALTARHPGLELRMSGRLPPAPLHGETTLALWFDAAARRPDIAYPLANVPYAAYCAADRTVTHDRWVMFRDDDADGPSFARVVERHIGVDRRIVLTATDASILAEAIRGGAGIGMLPTAVGDATRGIVRDDSCANPIERVLHLHLDPAIADLRRAQVVARWLLDAVEPALAATPIRADLPA
ncbi:LysR family transcriptional regulator [Aestuariibius sp. 2305UL40-4]|uniref:LysR family transcriptional regulator n=1 Tax=Aestuariibius violaceus TaxID=3234132 RepID=UPI00345E9551